MAQLTALLVDNTTNVYISPGNLGCFDYGYLRAAWLSFYGVYILWQLLNGDNTEQCCAPRAQRLSFGVGNVFSQSKVQEVDGSDRHKNRAEVKGVEDSVISLAGPVKKVPTPNPLYQCYFSHAQRAFYLT